ncbi:hypothetical protein JMB95_000712 [Salmonella enterica]|nr:hypothetical protein [Salmonella enterica]
MGQKFFDMQESSRLNMSFNCSGAFNIIYIMRTTAYRHDGKRLHRTNATDFLHTRPYDGMDFGENVPERLTARYVNYGFFMVSGHPLKPRQYVKIFTYCPESATDEQDERHAAGRQTQKSRDGIRGKRW